MLEFSWKYKFTDVCISFLENGGQGGQGRLKNESLDPYFSVLGQMSSITGHDKKK